MGGITPLRAIVALLTTFGAILIASRIGAPLSSALVAGIGGLVAGLVLGLRRNLDAVPETRPVDTGAGEIAHVDSVLPTLEELMNAIDDPSLLIVDRRVVRANPAAQALLGTHIIGEDVRLAIRHPAAAERLVGEHSGEQSRTAIELVGIGERERPWELIIHEMTGNTRFVRLADRSSVQTAEKMRVDFVANASHELRTPLASLIGYIETLQDGSGTDQKTRTRFLDIMHGEASRMQRLIGDLMSLSRIEAEKYRAPAEAIELGLLVEEACAATCSELAADPARIDLATLDEPVQMAGDRAQILQLVSNLVGNALKYGKDGGRVMVSYGPFSGAMVRLKVKDEGDGIPGEHLPRLTERFYRIEPSRSRSMGGTGLGLAIVKHIVERHRGRMNIASEAGQGTVVTVDLPQNPQSVSSARNTDVTKA